MALASAARPAASQLDALLLSCAKPAQAVRELSAVAEAEAPSEQFLQLLAEYGALPVDLAARLLRCTEKQVLNAAEKGVWLGWIRCTEYPGERYSWLSLREGGRRRVGPDVGRRKPPSSGLLTHRREVVEARLLLRDEMPGWRWVCEAAFRKRDNSGLTIPDGVLVSEAERWAIEVERSRKLGEKLFPKLQRLCVKYDRVVYFGSPTVRSLLAALQVEGRFSNLEVRPLPAETNGVVNWESTYAPYSPSDDARAVLHAVNEEGIVARAQLPRLMEWQPDRVGEALAELADNFCIRQGLSLCGDEGWVWCNYRGSFRSGTGLQPIVVPSGGGLVKRLVLMEIHFDVLARWSGATWIPLRRLTQDRGGSRAGLPRAVVEHEGLRYAVFVLESHPNRERTLSRFKQWGSEYAGVLCYRTQQMARWADNLLAEHDFPWVELRDFPKPPASAPYASLEDEWRTGKELYRPSEPEADALRLIDAEGLVSQVQLPRALGCSPEEADELVGGLLQPGCLKLRKGWASCTRRGGRLSGNPHPRTAIRIPGEGHLAERFELMEVRLSLGAPVSTGSWKTKRQLGRERKAEGNGSAAKHLPDAAALIDGEWHAVALFFREFRRKRIAALLSLWAAEYGRVRCYCREKDIASFERFIARYGLSGVDVMSSPVAPDAPARARQEAFDAFLATEKQQKDERYLPQVLAGRAVLDAVRRGELKKPECCEACGKKVDGARLWSYHEDHSRPLDVKWLCVKCHRQRGRQRPACEGRGKRATALTSPPRSRAPAATSARRAPLATRTCARKK